jgi:hypothetical protein
VTHPNGAQSAFPAAVSRLIAECLPNVDALDLLMLLLEEPHRASTGSELVARKRSIGLTEARVRKHLDAFVACGIVTEHEGRYGCALTTDHEPLRELVRMYNERPVTLIRAIYARSDERIRAFSDAFDVRRSGRGD